MIWKKKRIAPLKPKQNEKKREKTGIPKMKREKPKTFSSGWAIISTDLTEYYAKNIMTSLDDEMKERTKKGEVTFKFELVDLQKISIGLSPAELIEFQKKYRDSYQRLDRVVLKRMEESQKPIVKLKRKAYNALPEVKKRKKILAKRRRAILRLLKKKRPDDYKEALELCEETLNSKDNSSVAVDGATTTAQ